MSSELAELMFGLLNQRVGEEVVCTQWFFGKPMDTSGILESVVPFDKVVISGTVIPFVGERQAIEKIVRVSSQQIIYTNPRAVEYDKKLGEVPLAQEEMLGYSVQRNGAYESEKKEKTYFK